MRNLLLGRQRREVEEISQRLNDHRRALANCMQESKTRLGNTVGSPLGLGLCFGAGFVSNRLSGKVSGKRQGLSSLFRLGSKAAFTLI